MIHRHVYGNELPMNNRSWREFRITDGGDDFGDAVSGERDPIKDDLHCYISFPYNSCRLIQEKKIKVAKNSDEDRCREMNQLFPFIKNLGYPIIQRKTCTKNFSHQNNLKIN